MHDHPAPLRAHEAGQTGSVPILKTRRAIAVGAALIWIGFLLLGGTGLQGCRDGSTTAASYIAEVDAWHAQRIERLTAPTGWLTLVGLHPLQPGDNSLGSGAGNDIRLVAAAPAQLGVIGIAAAGTTLTPSPDITVAVGGQSYTGPRPVVALSSDAGGDPTRIEFGSLQMYLIQRGDGLFLRVKDRAAAALRDFSGVNRFPVEARWRVTARLDTTTAGDIAVANVLGQTEPTASPGTLHFELAGQALQLRPMGEPGQSLFLVFDDATNGHSTYGGGRFLAADAPDAQGRVILDFNRATNPPCVFSPYATCPLPPTGNRLPVEVIAGEKMWGEGH